MIILSPHLDDAVLSCGQLLAAYPRSTVITVFAGIPPEGLELTDFDRASGFDSGVQAISARREEDKRAAAVLDFTNVHLDLLDGQYEQARRLSYADLAKLLLPIIDKLPGVEPLAVPLGIMHPDHKFVGGAARRMALHLPNPVLIYEELPGRVLWPEETELLRTHMTRSEQVAGPIELKEAAITCYRSQIWALDRHACLVPERYWEPSRA